MRITESTLRRIIREEIIGEAPLDDIITYDVNQRQRSERTPSVAHPSTRSRYKRTSGASYVDITRDLMRSTKDNWVIITPSDTGMSDLTVGSPRFKEWLAEKRTQHPAGTIFAFVSTPPVGGDFKTPAWAVIHDLLGHSIENSGPVDRMRRVRWAPRELRLALHSALPRELQVSKSNDDKLPDILAAILMGRLDPDTAHRISKEYVTRRRDDHGDYYGEGFKSAVRQHDEIIDGMFAAVDEFVTEARAAGFVNLKPW
jgi:hypothetical protein